MEKSRRYLAWLVCFISMLALCADIQATEVKKYKKGLILDDVKLLENVPEVIDVKLNEQAIENILNYGSDITEQDLSGVSVAGRGAEFTTDQDITLFSNERNAQIRVEDAFINQIKSYDGSQSDHFPPIGSQGNSGSCTSWSMGYYQLTNNIANARNLDAKHNVKYRISPAWIHNLAKNREYEDYGTSEYDVCALLLKQGAPYWSDFPGTTTAENYKSWNPDAFVWEKALENRIDEWEVINVYDTVTEQLNLNNLKRTLLNGDVVSFGCMFDERLIYRNRIKFPDKNQNDAILTANQSTSNSGSHEMTIVGWDDTLAIDVDGNGTIDSYGALKIVNSWGTGGAWNNDNGCFWLAYDAILPESAVLSVNAGRQKAIYNNRVTHLKPKISYKPLMLLELTLKTESRRQLAVRIGTSDQNYRFLFDKPDHDYNENRVIFTFKNYQNNAPVKVNYDFYGNETNQKEAKFVFDLTDTVVGYCGTQYQFSDNNEIEIYIQVEDKVKDGYGSSLGAVRIIDRINDKITTVPNAGLQVDGSKKEVRLKATVVPGIIDSSKKLTLKFNYPIQKAAIDSGIRIQRNGQLYKDAVITHDKERKQVFIWAPSYGYPRGQYYTVDLSSIKSDGDNDLTGKATIDFYVP